MRFLYILIADNNKERVRLIRSVTNTEGWKTLAVNDGAEALKYIETGKFDLAIINLSISKVDGYEIIRQTREWSQIPIIIINDREDTEDRIKCLNIGADDYFAQPFRTDELIARVKAVLRQTEPSIITPSLFTNGDLKIDFVKRRVTVAARGVELTPIEYRLLQELALNVGKVLTHEYLFSRIWGPEYIQDREYLHVFMRHLRSKLESDPHNPKFIITVPWVGYQLEQY